MRVGRAALSALRGMLPTPEGENRERHSCLRRLLGGAGEAVGADDFGGVADGLDHAGGVGDALAGDVERGAVVDRGAEEGEADVEGEAFGPVVHLDGDVPLVVVHGEHDVVASVDGLSEDGVGGDGSGGVDAGADGVGDGGSDGVDLFAADESVLAAVGVEGGDADAGGREAVFGEEVVGEAERLEDATRALRGRRRG